MKTNKRVFYVLSSLLILCYSVLSPFYSVSALDDKKNNPPFHTTKTLSLEYGPNSKMDITNYLITTLFTAKDVYNRRIVWHCPAMTREQAYTSYKKAIANNSGWLITQKQGKTTVAINSSKDDLYSYSNVSVYWSEIKPDEQILRYNQSRDPYTDYYWSFNSSIRSSVNVLHLSYSNRDESIHIGCDKPGGTTVRLSADHLNLSDYNIKKGESSRISTFLNTFPYKLDKSITWDIGTIPDSLQQTLYPHFEYDLKHLKLKLKHLKEKDSIQFPNAWASYDNQKGYYIADKSDYYLQFTVQNRKGGDVVKNGLQYVRAGGFVDFELPDLGEYSVTAKYTIKVCYAHSYDRDKTITPAEGDYCFYTPPDEKQNIKYGERTLYLKADGSVKSGSTVGLDCPYGFCSELKQKPKYEDCSQYDWQFGGIKIPSPGSIACAVRNSFVWFFTDFIFGIIFPKIEDLQTLWDDLLNTIIDRLGFLALPFTFIKGVFTTVQAMTATNNTCAMSLTVFGSTANLELCKWRYQLPALWSFMQIFLQGGIAIGFLWTCYRLANRFFGIYVEDYEEEDHETYLGRWHDERTGEYGDWEKFRKD